MPDIDIRLTEPTADTADRIDDWLGNYISKPHAELGRSGAVCPFVEPSRRADSLVLYAAEWRPEFDLDHMVRIVETAVDVFVGHEWSSRNSNLHSLVVVVPDLPRESYGLIDEAHARTKDGVVARGCMLGQFHPECEEPAARNSAFPVNRSPVPLFAVRNMALHDVLFLHANDAWFAEYERRHGRQYDNPGRLDPELVRLFESARARTTEAGPRRNGNPYGAVESLSGAASR